MASVSGQCCPGRRGGQHNRDGCRCLIDAAPFHGLVRSLAAIGWPLQEQGRLIGCRYGRNFRVLTRDRIERGTAVQISCLHTQLWDVPGPSPRTATSRTESSCNRAVAIAPP